MAGVIYKWNHVYFKKYVTIIQQKKKYVTIK